jgi:hypothetical protein
MKKIITVTAIAAGFAFAGSASACNDLSFTGAMIKSSKQAQTAMNIAQAGNFSRGRSYVRQAYSTWLRSPSPCVSYLRSVRTQYGLALRNFDRGFSVAIAGDYITAYSYLDKGLTWIQKANDTMDAHGY